MRVIIIFQYILIILHIDLNKFNIFIFYKLTLLTNFIITYTNELNHFLILRY